MYLTGFISSNIIINIISYIYNIGLDNASNVGLVNILFKDIKKKNKDNILNYKNERRKMLDLIEEYKTYPRIELKDILLKEKDKYYIDFNQLYNKYNKSILYLPYESKNIIYLFSNYNNVDFVFKIENLNIPGDYFYKIMLLNKDININQICSTFYLKNNNFVMNIDNLDTKCIKNNYNIEWYIFMLISLVNMNGYSLMINFSDVYYMDKNSKKNKLVNYLINKKFAMYFKPFYLIEKIKDIDIKNILNHNHIKYNEKLIKDGKVYFGDYYNSMNNIIMLKMLFEDIKNKNTIIHKKNKKIRKFSEIFENKDKTDLNKFDILNKIDIEKLGEENLVHLITEILTYIVDVPNILFYNSTIEKLQKMELSQNN
jgi:hypothetical protein